MLFIPWDLLIHLSITLIARAPTGKGFIANSEPKAAHQTFAAKREFTRRILSIGRDSLDRLSATFEGTPM
jgi:hypothetical protein